MRREYDQARTFGDFRRKFGGGRPQQDQQNQQNQQDFAYQYTANNFNWRNHYNEMSAEEQEMIRKQLDAMSRKLVLYGIGIVFLMIFFFKSPAFYYAIGPRGQLTPIYTPMYGPPGMQQMQMDPYGGDPRYQGRPGGQGGYGVNPFDLNAAYSQNRPIHDIYSHDPRYGRG